jgi:hypothetical protein
MPDEYSQNAYFAAWSAVVDAISSVAPNAWKDTSKSAVDCAVTWIKAQGPKSLQQSD